MRQLTDDDVLFVRRSDGGYCTVQNNTKLADAVVAVVEGRAIIVDRDAAEQSVLYSDTTAYRQTL